MKIKIQIRAYMRTCARACVQLHTPVAHRSPSACKLTHSYHYIRNDICCFGFATCFLHRVGVIAMCLPFVERRFGRGPTKMTSSMPIWLRWIPTPTKSLLKTQAITTPLSPLLHLLQGLPKTRKSCWRGISGPKQQQQFLVQMDL